jgi:prepilin-type N-terminal cleavage/methylation domain-containing protein/prepilin-type processing-associated H-X9-DG protein
MADGATRRRAFTLIELLVVITIIVVLLALLTPALDKAIYQAELTVCGTQLKAIASSTITYAYDFRRYYPDRAVINSRSNSQPLMLASDGRDDRPLLGKYIVLKMFQDPVVEQYAIEPDETVANARVHASYQLWFGVRFDPYTSPDGTSITPSGMKKIGDKFSWYDDYPFSARNSTVNTYSLLATDFDFSGVARRAMNSHPDASGTLTLKTSNPQASAVPSLPTDAPVEYFSRFEGSSTNRGATDSNYAYADGSVLRLNGLSVDYDERLGTVPYQSGSWVPWSNWCVQIPFR